MDRLILVEGIPGSGKTTAARNIAAFLRGKADKLSLYTESEPNPADMAWNALLTKGELDRICAANPLCASALIAAATPWRDKLILGYAAIPNLPEALFNELEDYEIYDGRADENTYISVHRARYSEFAEKAGGVSLFECALLQNAFNELTLFYQKTPDEVREYLSDILLRVKRLNPLIIYLKPDSDASIMAAAAERVNERGERVWEKHVIRYVESSPYGKAHGLSGLDGMLEYFRLRQAEELKLLPLLPAESVVVEVDAANRQKQNEDVIAALAGALGIKE